MKILFVCLGNICRSPTAESIFRKKFSLANKVFHFDSAGTAGYHIGENSDPRSIKHAVNRGYEMTHIGRQVTITDLDQFDYVLAMDKSNYTNLLSLSSDKSHHHKIHMVTAKSVNLSHNEIPDPYYGHEKDFELVIDLLEACAEDWFKFFNKF